MANENALELEWLRNVRKIEERNTQFKELEYFVNVSKNSVHSYKNKNGQKIVVLGNLFPIEIVRAMDIDYYCVYGGSFAMTLSQNDNLPKDTDDVSRSIYGAIKSEDLGLKKSDALLIPLYNDNMRKLKTMLSDFVTVISYEVPIDKEDSLQKRRFISEINRAVKEIEKHFHKKLSSKKLNEQLKISKKAFEAFSIFESLYFEKQASLTASAFLLIANSFRICKDINDWIKHLCLMNEEFRKNNDRPLNNHPEIILLGSPLYGPNYKSILLIEEMGLNVRTIIHPDIEHFKIAGNMNCSSVSVRELSLRYLEADISPVYIQNGSMDKLIKNAIKEDNVSGIIALAHKGQIDYEYEIKRVEKLIENTRLSLIRIETVYDYHDFEQIRVRIEAFSEMLNSLQ